MTLTRPAPEALLKIDLLRQHERGRARWAVARTMNLGPFPGDGINRIAGWSNFLVLVALMGRPDLIKVKQLSNLTGWGEGAVMTVLGWGADRRRGLCRRRGYHTFALTPRGEWFWQTEAYHDIRPETTPGDVALD